MDALSSGLTVLTAMITPAVLISACGTLILSTSTRLSRIVDRVRSLSDEFEHFSSVAATDGPDRKRLAVLFGQLDLLTSRARLLQRSLTTFYLAVGVFVATSLSIGFVAITSQRYGWIPQVLGLAGACFLFYGSVLMILEARLALSTTYKEMDYLWERGQAYAPPELLKKRKP